MRTQQLFKCSIIFLLLVPIISCNKSKSNCTELKNEYNAAWGSWNLNPNPTSCLRCKTAIANYLNSNCTTDNTERQQLQSNLNLVTTFCP